MFAKGRLGPVNSARERSNELRRAIEILSRNACCAQEFSTAARRHCRLPRTGTGNQSPRVYSADQGWHQLRRERFAAARFTVGQLVGRRFTGCARPKWFTAEGRGRHEQRLTSRRSAAKADANRDRG